MNDSLQLVFQNCSLFCPPWPLDRAARAHANLINARMCRQPAGLPGLCRRRRRLAVQQAAPIVRAAAGLESAVTAALTEEAAAAATSDFFRAIMGLGVAACFLGASARGVQVRAAGWSSWAGCRVPGRRLPPQALVLPLRRNSLKVQGARRL